MSAGGTGSAAEGSVISLPSGGGAVGGLGETFAPDLFTGTGNYSVPVALPAGPSASAASIRPPLRPVQLLAGQESAIGCTAGWAMRR